MAADFNKTKKDIVATVYENYKGEIMGDPLQKVMLEMIGTSEIADNERKEVEKQLSDLIATLRTDTDANTDSVARLNELKNAGYALMGVAKPGDTPTVIEGEKQMWLCNTVGTYTKFGGVSMAEEGLAVITHKGSEWNILPNNLVTIVQELGDGENKVVSQHEIMVEYPVTNGGKLRLYQGAVNANTGEDDTDNNQFRVKTGFIKTPFILNFNEGYRYRWVCMYDKDFKYITSEIRNPSYIKESEAEYVRINIQKTNESEQILPTENIIKSIVLSNQIDAYKKNIFMYGNELRFENGSIQFSNIGGKLNYLPSNIFVRTPILKTPIDIELNPQYLIRYYYLLDKDGNLVENETYLDDAKLKISEEQGYYVQLLIRKGGSEFSKDEDIVKTFYQGNDVETKPNRIETEIGHKKDWINWMLQPDTGLNHNYYIKKGKRSEYYKINDTYELNITFNDNFKLLYFMYDKNGYFLRSNTLTEWDIPYKLKLSSESVEYMRFYIINSAADEDFDIETDANLRIMCVSSSNNHMERCKHPYSELPISFRFRYKGVKNGGLNIYSGDVSNPVKLSDTYYYSGGMIALPKNYTEKGEPVRLIYWAPGSGFGRPEGEWPNERWQIIMDYLNAEGYAVACSWNWGMKEGDDRVEGMEFWCSPSNYATHNACYHYLIENFNIKTDGVFLFGKSQGGMAVYSLNECTSIPVIARCNLSGTTNPMGNLWGYSDKDKFACFEDFGFSGLENDGIGTSGIDNDVIGHYTGEAKCMYKRDENDYEWTPERIAYIKKNCDKLKCFTPPYINELNLPIENTFDKVDTMSDEDWKALNPKITSQIPTLYESSIKDFSVQINKNMQTALLSGGNISQVRLLPPTINPADDHWAVDGKGINISVTTRFGEVVNNVPMAIAEMLDFFRHFE